MLVFCLCRKKTRSKSKEFLGLKNIFIVWSFGGIMSVLLKSRTPYDLERGDPAGVTPGRWAGCPAMR